jgi:hypothetical protein
MSSFTDKNTSTGLPVVFAKFLKRDATHDPALPDHFVSFSTSLTLLETLARLESSWALSPSAQLLKEQYLRVAVKTERKEGSLE